MLDEYRYNIVDGIPVFPDGLNVYAADFSLCEKITSLPEGLVVDSFLDLEGCSSLNSLPEGLQVEGWLDIGRCTSLKSLPKNINFGDLFLSGGVDIHLDGMWLSLDHEIPEISKHQAIGKRIIDVIDHYLLRGHWIGDLVIVGIDEDGDFTIATPEDAAVILSENV